MAALTFKVDGETLPLEVTLSMLQEADPEIRKKAAAALAKTFKDNIRTFTLITNTLAKDKDISDRWRGFTDIADSRHLANRVERDVVDALAAAVKDAYPRLSHRYYAMKAKWLGMEQMEFWDRNAPLPETPATLIPWSEAKETVSIRLCGLPAGNGRYRPALFRWRLDRCAGAPRQGTGRLCTSDGTVCASLCAGQLYGQAARRDDACP